MKSTAPIAGFLLTLMIASCAQKPSDEPELRNSALTVHVTTALTFETDSLLTVTYTTNDPVKKLEFARVPDNQRLSRWSPAQDEFEISHANGIDYIQHVNAKPFTKASFTVPMTYTVLPKDYAPFMPYSDGGVLLHSGRFQVCPETCEPENSNIKYPMQVAAKGYGHIILNGYVLTDEVAWTDKRDGTMVYIGTAKLIKTDHVIAIIDPAIPDDIQVMLNGLFPNIMDYFAEHLGFLQSKPMLFAALDRYTKPDGNPNSNSFSSQGGTLPGQVFMHLEGDGWLEPLEVRGEYTGENLVWFFAHEAGHLFQRAANYDSSQEDAWIHEGGAEVFAAIAMQDLALLPESSIQKRKLEAVEACLDGLKQGDLRTAGARQNFNLYYSCGMIIQLAVHNAVQSEGEEKGIYLIWEAFLEALKQGKTWNELTFMSIITEETNPDTVKFVNSIVSGEPTLTQETMLEAIQ